MPIPFLTLTGNRFLILSSFFFHFYLIFTYLNLLEACFLQDFPDDPSGAFIRFSKFVESNFKICRWIGLSIFFVQVSLLYPCLFFTLSCLLLSQTPFLFVQGASVLLAMLLKALGPHPHYDSDDEYDLSTVSLLHDARQPHRPYVVGEPIYGPKPDSWTVRINERANR